MKTTVKTTKTVRDLRFEAIAAEHLFIDTLETRNSDGLDFHDVSVWGVKAALEAAYEAGRKAATADARLAAQRDQLV